MNGPKWLMPRAGSSFGLLVGLFWASTMGQVVSSDEAEGSFSVTAIEISVDPSADDTALFSAEDIFPGWEEYAPLEVINSGGGTLEYTMSTAADNDDALALRDELEATVVLVADSGSCGSGAFPGDPADQVSGATSSLASLAIGTERSLAESASEWLCFHVELPSDATVDPGAETTATFTFDAQPPA